MKIHTRFQAITVVSEQQHLFIHFKNPSLNAHYIISEHTFVLRIVRNKLVIVFQTDVLNNQVRVVHSYYYEYLPSLRNTRIEIYEYLVSNYRTTNNISTSVLVSVQYTQLVAVVVVMAVVKINEFVTVVVGVGAVSASTITNTNTNASTNTTEVASKYAARSEHYAKHYPREHALLPSVVLADRENARHRSWGGAQARRADAPKHVTCYTRLSSCTLQTIASFYYVCTIKK